MNNSLHEILSREYMQNSVLDYCIAFSIIVLGILLVRIFKRYFLNRLKTAAALTETHFDDLVVKGTDRFLLPIINFLFIYWGIKYLALSVKAEHVLTVATSVVIAFFAIRLISSSIQLLVSNRIRKQENGETKLKQLTGLMIIINIVIWILGAIFLVDNLGYNVTTLLTGVGIGGIAIALAAQNIIGDLFNYFVIFFDKPFEVGDAINIDDQNGTIEYIGLKTTHLRSLTGEQLIISNGDLTKSRIHNFKRQETRRIQFDVNVTFHNDPELLEKIPSLIKDIIVNTADTKFDRTHFSKLTEYGLTYEIVYLVTVPDYLKYMDIQQNINLQIIKAFKKNNIQFLIREDKPGEWDNAPAA